MTYEALLKELQAKKFRPVYLLEGEEDFFIDQISDYLEHRVLTETEREFNLTVFYGKDADWSEVINASRRYPMFADRQVVLVKEAQSMKTLDKLEAYVNNPLESTVLAIVYKHGKLDGRLALKKKISKQGAILTTQRLKDDKIPDWISSYLRAQDHGITPKAAILLTDHIGNDLARQANEINKLLLNLPHKKKIDEDDVERYVGISKEYNIFEFQRALGNKDMSKALKIMNYFKANPKAAPLPMLFTVLYGFFSKVHALIISGPGRQRDVVSSLRIPVYYLEDYQKAARLYRQGGIERILLLLHEYNLRYIGIADSGTPPGELVKELLIKIMR
jgi:DNA polymerase-3 subunit delta